MLRGWGQHLAREGDPWNLAVLRSLFHPPSRLSLFLFPAMSRSHILICLSSLSSQPFLCCLFLSSTLLAACLCCLSVCPQPLATHPSPLLLLVCMPVILSTCLQIKISTYACHFLGAVACALFPCVCACVPLSLCPFI